MSEKPHERLKAAIEARRTELGLSLRQVAEGAGITTETLRAIRNGQNPSALTKSGLEQTLKWKSGSVDRVREGGAPEPAEASGRRRRPRLRRRSVMDEAEEVMAENERMAEEIVNSWRHLDAEAQAMVADLIDMLKRKAEEQSRNDRGER
ncbi:helix-turn-helix domain-containing protein [Actinomadura sediminis]|uniref:Helix-turn-helix domain-containing protein n=1 Tax=Actinomadura sediminis TaxID=1038904 RepID=A0ABW3ET33_9ACTN